VSLWLVSGKRQVMRLGGSTVFSKAQVKTLLNRQDEAAQPIKLMQEHKRMFDLMDHQRVETLLGHEIDSSFLLEASLRYCLPLNAGGRFMGLITLDDRVRGKAFSVEELDLLQTISAQAATSLLNLRLLEKLQQAKEMEAFQRMGAFFVHDLKNLASNLSLLTQNMAVHFDNPAIRQYALVSMRRNVEKINRLCGRVNLLQDRLELQLAKVDLNEVVRCTLDHLNHPAHTRCIEKLRPVPVMLADAKQIEEVLTNLLANAKEAVGEKGQICIATGTQNGSVVLEVTDNGCGMSDNFVDQCLLRPFKTTKKRGIGIGLFQSKMIVVATNVDLDNASRAQQFREDLYYRLAVVVITMPLPRDRQGDILPLANAFLKRYASEVGKTVKGFSPPAIRSLETYPWPGNVRELENRIKRAVVMAEGKWVSPADLDLSTCYLRYEGMEFKDARAAPSSGS
jgi:putative PEP-CTERM system histidine kinase